jgi:hypothetical protein
MAGSDRTLVAIVAGLVLLVVVAFVLVLRQPPPTYRGEDTPDGAAFDYVLALSQHDYLRAYGLLGDVPGRPKTLDAFITDIDLQSWVFGTEEGSAGLRVLGTETSADQSGAKLVTVRLERTVFTDRGLLDSSEYSQTFQLRLRQSADGSWRVVGGDRFLDPCWLDGTNCNRSLRAPTAEGTP